MTTPHEHTDGLRVEAVQDGPETLRLIGDLDLNAEDQLQEELHAPAGGTLRLDLGPVRFVDLHGARALIRRLAQLRASGVRVLCVRRSAALSRTLALIDDISRDAAGSRV